MEHATTSIDSLINWRHTTQEDMAQQTYEEMRKMKSRGIYYKSSRVQHNCACQTLSDPQTKVQLGMYFVKACCYKKILVGLT